MQLHMLNWQCFIYLNIAQLGLRYKILIIQFANIYPGCQMDFVTKKKEKKETQKTTAQETLTTFHRKENWTWQPVPYETEYLKEHLTASADL